MKKKGKAPTKEQVSQLVKKKTTFKAKEIRKMLQWIKMNANKLKCARWASLENVFTLQWTMLQKDLL